MDHDWELFNDDKINPFGVEWVCKRCGGYANIVPKKGEPSKEPRGDAAAWVGEGIRKERDCDSALGLRVVSQ